MNEETMWVCILTSIVIISVISYHSDDIEGFEESQKKKAKQVIGQQKAVRVGNIRPILPHPAMIIQSNKHTWVVKVPLTPFQAPVYMPPFDGKSTAAPCFDESLHS